ncbi:MAG TPA: sodium:calcium antiporter, partial [Candidatus Dormibacteraeota bacterium]|nr:sodium:calcium antiporter [Candidatus Dormibacteraeota bacterium]
VEDMPEPLHIVRWRPGQPSTALVGLQLLVAIAMLVAGSQLFVGALHSTAAALHTPELVLALVIVPLATELPETLNSVLWVRSRDDMLAFGNVAGSATFQSCVLAFIGLVFTSWQPGGSGVIGALLTLATALFLLAMLWRGRVHGGLLLIAGVPWFAFVVAQLVTGGHLAA